MADKAISALPAVTTLLDTDILPSVASGVTSKITIANLKTLLGAQPLSANLTALAALATTGFVTRTGTNTFTTRNITGTSGQIVVTNGDGIAGVPTLTLASTITAALLFSSVQIFDTGSGASPYTATTPSIIVRTGRSVQESYGTGNIQEYVTASGTRGAPSILASSSMIGKLSFIGYNATTFAEQASYYVDVPSLWVGASSRPTRHVWTGTSTGATAVVTWMNLVDSGLLVGVTTRVGTERLRIAGGAIATPTSTDVIIGGGQLSVGSATDSTSAAAGSIWTAGGAAITKNLWVGAEIRTTGAEYRAEGVSDYIISNRPTNVAGGQASSLTVGARRNDATNGSALVSYIKFLGLDGSGNQTNGGMEFYLRANSAGGSESADKVATWTSGNNLLAAGFLELHQTLDATATGTASLVLDGGISVAKTVLCPTIVQVSTATSNTTGAMGIVFGPSTGFNVASVGIVNGAFTNTNFCFAAILPYATAVGGQQGGLNFWVKQSSGGTSVQPLLGAQLDPNGKLIIKSRLDSSDYTVVGGNYGNPSSTNKAWVTIPAGFHGKIVIVHRYGADTATVANVIGTEEYWVGFTDVGANAAFNVYAKVGGTGSEKSSSIYYDSTTQAATLFLDSSASSTSTCLVYFYGINNLGTAPTFTASQSAAPVGTLQSVSTLGSADYYKLRATTLLLGTLTAVGSERARFNGGSIATPTTTDVIIGGGQIAVGSAVAATTTTSGAITAQSIGISADAFIERLNFGDGSTSIRQYAFTQGENLIRDRLQLDVNTRVGARFRLTLQASNTGGVTAQTSSICEFSVRRADGGPTLEVHEIRNSGGGVSGFGVPYLSTNSILIPIHTYNNGTASTNNVAMMVETVCARPTRITYTAIDLASSASAAVSGRTIYASTLFTSGLTVTQIANAATSGLDVTNSSAGVSADSRIKVINDAGQFFQAISYSSGNTGSVFGITRTSVVAILAGGSGTTALLIGTSGINAPTIFGINASEVGRFSSGTLSTGTFSVAYTTPATSASAAALVVAGGIGGATGYFSGNVSIIGSTASMLTVQTSNASTVNSTFTSTATSGAGAGFGLVVRCDDGAAMASGDRLGVYLFSGATDAIGTHSNSAAIIAYAAEAFSAGVSGTRLEISLSPIGGSTRNAVANFSSGTIATGILNLNYTLDTTTLSSASIVGAGGAAFAKAIWSGSNILAVTGIGYTTGLGAGGTVTQATSKATGVTLSKATGTITLNAASLAANTTVSFIWTNTLITATDIPFLVHDSVGTFGAYSITWTPAAGSVTVNVRNITAGALAEAIVLRFGLMKGSIT